MFTVEQNVVQPPIKRSCGRKPIYPLRTMNVGESFFVPCDSQEVLLRKQVSILGTIRNSRIPNKKFSTRKVENGLRVWRIE